MQISSSVYRQTLRRVIVSFLFASLGAGQIWAAADSSTIKPAPAKAKVKTTAPAAKKASTPAAKQDSETITLPAIIVTAATRSPQPVDTTATSTTVVTHDDLTQQKYANVVDALTTVPGLTLGVHGTPGQAVSVFTRGTDSASTLLTIDGRRQAPDISGFYDFANLTLDNVDQIEVVRTPSSAIEGGNSIGGVINLTTLNGRGMDHAEGSVGFEAGSFDTFREIAQSRGAVAGFDYGVAFSRQDSDYPGPNKDYHNTAYRGNFGYTFSPNIYFDVQTSYTTSRAGSPGPVNFGFDPIAELYRETWNISPRLTIKLTDFYTSTLYYNRTQLRQVFFDSFGDHNRTQSNTDSVDWQNDFQIARNWKITVGIQGDNQDVNDFNDATGQLDITNGLFNLGGYVQSQWEIVPGLNLINSVRYDSYSDYVGSFSWRQGVSYRTPVTDTLLHASVSHAYRPPTVAELYFPPSFGFATSNPDLVPERSLGWEIGAAQPFFQDHLKVSATYFHNAIKDLITSTAATNFIPFNVGDATTDGVELGADALICDQLKLNVNYTYLNADNDVTHTRLSEQPRHTTNFTAIWTPLKPVTVTLGGTWVVDRESSPNKNQEDYFVLRASATYAINDHVSIWVRGENILNESYSIYANYPSLRTGAYGGVKLSF